MTSTRSYWIAAVFLVSLILRGQGTGFAETGEDRIYWADMEGIYWSNLGEGTTQRIITSDTRRPGKIAVDVAGGKIYWVDRRGGTIQWSDLDGSNSEILFELGSFAIDLDLDLEREKIYFSAVYSHGDYTDGEVYRSDLDGSDTELLLADPVGSPILALDTLRKHMYLGDLGSIYRVDLSGSGREEVLEVLSEEYSPIDIALDMVENKLYWTRSDRSIWRSNPDGSDVEDILRLGDYPVDIALDPDEGKMYWSFDGPYFGGLMRANLDGSDVEDLVVRERVEVVGLALDLEGRKVYWSEARGTIHRADMDGTDVEDFFAPIVRDPYSVAMDPGDGRIYWSDLLTGSIQRAGPDGSGLEIVIGGLKSPRGVLLRGNRLYWADPGWENRRAGMIQSAKQDGSDRETIVRGNLNPDQLALDLTHRKIYWTESGRSLIRRADLDGTDIEDFPVGAIPRGIALDVVREKMYWTWQSGPLGGATGISRSSLDGTDIEVLSIDDALFSDDDWHRQFWHFRAVALDPAGGKIYWNSLHCPPPGPDELPSCSLRAYRADLDGSTAEEVAWLTGYMGYEQPGLRVWPPYFVGNALALDLSHRTAVSTRNSVPISTTLRRNHPNPFNGSTLISYTLAAPGPVTLVVYNTLGQPVRTLVDKVQASGLYSLPWQPAETLASGVYLYRLTTSDAVLTRRLALLR